MGVRIQELPETTGIKKEDVLIVEDGQGTKKGTVNQLDEALGVSQLKKDLGKLGGFSSNIIETNVLNDIENSNIFRISNSLSLQQGNVKIVPINGFDNLLSIYGTTIYGYQTHLFGDSFIIKPNTTYTMFISCTDIKDNEAVSMLLCKTSTKEPVKNQDGVSNILFDISHVESNRCIIFNTNVTEETECNLAFYIPNVGTVLDRTFRIHLLEGNFSKANFDIKSLLSVHDKRISNAINISNVSNTIRYKNIAKFNDRSINYNGIEITTGFLSSGENCNIKMAGTSNGVTIYRFSETSFILKPNTKYTFVVSDVVGEIPVSMHIYDKATGAPIKYGDGVDNISIPLRCPSVVILNSFNINDEKECVLGIYVPNNIVFNGQCKVYMVEGRYSMHDIYNGFSFEKYTNKIPVLILNGSMDGISKDNKVNLKYIYGIRTGSCTLKWQGSSSINYPKKNYTITFDTDFEAKTGWGSQKKYCLKANYIDFSQSRNVVSAKLWGQIVSSRTTIPTWASELPNNGAIDGFPIMLVINGQYQGIYTFNIPKDKWLFGMGSGAKEAIVTAEDHTTATCFKGSAILDGTDFDIEYSSETDTDVWVKDSINNMINACINSTGISFIDAVNDYIDIDSAIDYYIFTCLLTGTDMVDKNYILVTFDGTKWYFSAYDLDTTFGNYYDGTKYYKVGENPTFVSYNNTHRLMHLIYTYAKERLKSRYNELRSSVLSEANVFYVFENFINQIPKALYDEENNIWEALPSTSTGNLNQIITDYMLRCKILDDEINSLN